MTYFNVISFVVTRGHTSVLLDPIAALLVKYQSAEDNNAFSASELRLR